MGKNKGKIAKKMDRMNKMIDRIGKFRQNS